MLLFLRLCFCNFFFYKCFTDMKMIWSDIKLEMQVTDNFLHRLLCHVDQSKPKVFYCLAFVTTIHASFLNRRFYTVLLQKWFPPRIIPCHSHLLTSLLKVINYTSVHLSIQKFFISFYSPYDKGMKIVIAYILQWSYHILFFFYTSLLFPTLARWHLKMSLRRRVLTAPIPAFRK